MILLDISMAFHRALWMNVDNIKDNPEFVSHMILTQISSFAKKFGASKTNKMVICVDSSSWRKQYYLDNRKNIPGLENESYKGSRVKSDTVDWDTVYSIYDNTIKALKDNSDMTVIRVKDAEADDIIACLTKQYKDQETIWIVSSDKDFAQLQEEGKVYLFDQHKQAFRPQVDVDQFIKLHCLLGDKSDNIFSVRKGVGEKTALKMLKDLDIILQTSPDIRARYEFNQNLIDFKFIPQYVHDAIIEEYTKQEFSYNGMKLMTDFLKLKLVKHVENIANFKLGDKEIKTKINQHFIELNKNKEIEKTNLEDFFS